MSGRYRKYNYYYYYYKERGLYRRSNALLRTFHFCSEEAKNKLLYSHVTAVTYICVHCGSSLESESESESEIFIRSFQTQETSAKTITGRCRRGHLEK